MKSEVYFNVYRVLPRLALRRPLDVGRVLSGPTAAHRKPHTPQPRQKALRRVVGELQSASGGGDYLSFQHDTEDCFPSVEEEHRHSGEGNR